MHKRTAKMFRMLDGHLYADMDDGTTYVASHRDGHGNLIFKPISESVVTPIYPVTASPIPVVSVLLRTNADPA